jgi:predicted  nucleic acid-binding Zn-ribbon protein
MNHAAASLLVTPNATLYRNPQIRAVIDEHRSRQADARTLSGLAAEISHLRTALEAVAGNVRRHEERVRRLERQAKSKQPQQQAGQINDLGY